MLIGVLSKVGCFTRVAVQDEMNGVLALDGYFALDGNGAHMSILALDYTTHL